MRILLIEDEPAIVEVVRHGLEKANYTVDTASDGRIGRELAQRTRYALIILDLMLPGEDGWSICTRLRAGRDTIPILMLTARSTVQERVRGLEIGADDYLSKPFDFQELLARVRALLRRDRVHKSRIICVEDLQIDTATCCVTRAGREVRLTRREYTLLEALATHQGHILTREMVQERVWLDDDSYSNTVDVHIGILRKKIDAGHSVKLIHTVRGLGYTLRTTQGGEEP